MEYVLANHTHTPTNILNSADIIMSVRCYSKGDLRAFKIVLFDVFFSNALLILFAIVCFTLTLHSSST